MATAGAGAGAGQEQGQLAAAAIGQEQGKSGSRQAGAGAGARESTNAGDEGRVLRQGRDTPSLVGTSTKWPAGKLAPNLPAAPHSQVAHQEPILDRAS